jgi:hypothetical protein
MNYLFSDCQVFQLFIAIFGPQHSTTTGERTGGLPEWSANMTSEYWGSVESISGGIGKLTF